MNTLKYIFVYTSLLRNQKNMYSRGLYLEVPPEGSIPVSGIGIASCTAATHEVYQQAPVMLPSLL